MTKKHSFITALVLIVCVAFAFALAACDTHAQDDAYQVNAEKWNGVFTDKSLLINGNFTVTYSVVPVGESTPTATGTLKVDGNKYENVVGAVSNYFEKAGTSPDENGEYAYKFFVKNDDEWIYYPAHYDLAHFDGYIGTILAPFEVAVYDANAHCYTINTLLLEGSDGKYAVYFLRVWFENGAPKMIRYDANNKRYTFEFSACGTTQVTLPDATEVDPANDPTIGGNDESIRIVDDIAAVADPEALVNGLFARGVSFTYLDLEGEEQAYSAKGNKFYSTVYEEYYYDFSADDAFDYYTKDGDWQKATIGYEDMESEFDDKAEALQSRNEGYQSTLCEGMGLVTMFGDLFTMNADKKEELTFLDRDAYKYFYSPEDSMDLTVIVDKETGVILGWTAQYKVLGFTLPGFGCELASFAVDTDVVFPL